MRASVLAVWGSKALENIVDLDLSFDVETEKSVLRRKDQNNDMWVSHTPRVSPWDEWSYAKPRWVLVQS